MEKRKLEFAIVGGGIAGLATAIGLRNAGIQAVVFEAAPEFKPLGAGLVLAVNAMKALGYLEMGERVSEVGMPMEEMYILNQRGSTLAKNKTGMANERWKSYKLHRGDLHTVLLSALPEEQVVFGKRLRSVSGSDGEYMLEFKDGTSVQTRYLISAEGIHSEIRRNVLPGSSLRYAGYTCWRGIAHNAAIDLKKTSETWGRNGRFGIVPLTDNCVYWFAVVTAPQNSPEMAKWTLEDLKSHFREYHPSVGEVLRSTDPSGILWNDIHDLAPIPHFAFGNTVLIGDAAHATTPNMGQGACMALEDAAVLVHCLSGEKNVEQAFRVFEQKRLRRTHDIVQNSWKIGKIAQNQHPVTGAIRNMLLRMIPGSVSQKRLEKIVDFDVNR